MARRIVLGERANGDYGLFVSAPSEDANSSNKLTFDSNATFTSGIHAYGQGSLTTRTSVRFTTPKQIYTAEPSASNNTRIGHSLGYAPQVFLRWCYSDEIFTNPSGYPSGSYGVTALTPGRLSSQTEGFRFVNLGGEPQEIYEVNNDIGMGLDFEVDSSYLYIANYEAGFKGMQNAGGDTQETKYTGLTIYYAYIITTAPDNGLKL